MNPQVLAGFKHYSERLKERFNIEITYDEYLNTRVFKRTLDKKYKGKTVKYLFGELIHVYYIAKDYEYPITVYKLERTNKSGILRICC